MVSPHASHRWPTRPEEPPSPDAAAPSPDHHLAHLTVLDLDRRIAQAEHEHADTQKRITSLRALQAAMSGHNVGTYGELPLHIRDRHRHALEDRWRL
jgi:hypothetical protein